ncbi:type II toxin-antitoxin system VapC family toxin [Caulobacter henricii]|uniref:Plasmid stabilization protein n=1 Tax=Caulobacter henricii TaxID=69395 RepID=A0A0P0NWJ9_9CAUL|nr:type II toxin-antitoxin system VapC family toxin [Caulobacter henricii]ALL12221.1 plasmid stabilization protein [Caulobacter henricii]
MKGWLVDTNVIAALINPNGAPSVKAWAAGQPEARMFISVLSLGEYDKGIHNLATDHPDRSRYIAARDALAGRFAGRVLSVSDPVVRRWGKISGAVKLRTGHAPSVIDTLLAATALEHDLFLVTRNTRDVQDSGAPLFNPWTDDPADFPLA